MSPLLAATLPDLLIKAMDKIFPDPSVAAEQKLKILELQQAGEFKALEVELQQQLGQIEVNKIEAASESVFKSGWRPAFGWVGVFVLVSELVVRPYLPWLMEVFGFYVPQIPSIDTEMFWPLIFGLLGLGGMRSWDKRKGG